MKKHYDEILNLALSYIQDTRPADHHYRWAAFSNSVAYILTGILGGGFGGPSAREHVACMLRHDDSLDKDDIEAVYEAVEKSVFGPLTEEHLRAHDKELCLQEAPEDLAMLR